MALTLIATAAAEDANTYVTLAEAESIMEARLHKTNWTNASDADKNIALVWATNLLDRQVDWDGSKYDDDSALRWPRSGIMNQDGIYLDDDVIPTFLKEATTFYAFYLLSEDRLAENDLMGFSYIRAGSVAMNIDKRDRKAVIPPEVWDIIKVYGSKTMGTRMLEHV